MRKTFSILIILLILSSCKYNNSKSYSTESICDCYSKSEIVKFDQKLNSCLLEFNKSLKSKDLQKAELTELTKELISNCSQYQKDFNKVLLNKYSKRNKENIELERIELLEKINSDENKPVNLIRLSELEIVAEDYEKAELIINQSLELDSSIETAYLVKGFLNHRKKDFEEAIADFKTMRKITSNNDLKFMADLWILNLKEEMK